MLDDLGLSGVDAVQWFISTMPELLRVNINAGNMTPVIQLQESFNQDFISPAQTDTSFNVATAQNTGLIKIISNLAITPTTNNIDEFRFVLIDPGATERRILWRDFTNGPFPLGPYNMDNSDETRAWGARGLNKIMLLPKEIASSGSDQSLEMRLIDGVGVVKSCNLDWQEISYRPEDFLAAALP